MSRTVYFINSLKIWMNKKWSVYLKLVMLLMTVALLGGCHHPSNENNNDTSSGAYKYKQDLNIIEDNYRTYYEVFLYSFCDSDGDGIGDIQGLISKLDYINDGNPETDTDLGLNGIWLMPIMPSATYHKYDVIDYYNIDEEYGTLDDFKQLVSECNKRGIKLIIDLVLNHTSTKNEWFLEATDYLENLPKGKKPSAKECPYIDYYNFVKGEGPNSKYYQVGNSDWYYEAVFWDQMPDLNLACEALRQDLQKIADYWLDLGVGGFRLDAAKEYYSGEPDKNIQVLKWFTDYVKNKDKENYLVAEIWEGANIYKEYYKSGVDSIFNFSFGEQSGKIVKSLVDISGTHTAKAFGEAIVSIQNMLREEKEDYIDAPFLSNHDTGRVAGFVMYKPEKIKMAWAMNLFSSGNAFLYYGEEIGMSGSGRDENVRAPMNWSSQDSTGMTNGPAEMEEVEHRFPAVDEQVKDPLSIYNFVKQVIRIRNENPEIARGVVEYMDDITDENICAITKTYQDSKLVMLYNISAEERNVSVNKEKYGYEGIRGYVCATEEEVTLSGEEVSLPPYSVVILK